MTGQINDPIYQLLNSTDKKKLEKAYEDKNKADETIEEVNQLYLETFRVQADYQLGEKEIKKKVSQLESKAQEKQLTAIELYRKSNESVFGINKTYIEKFWSEFSGNENEFINARLIEEQSNDLYYQASLTRKEAAKIKENKDKIKQFNDAYDLELRAIEKQKTALGYYYALESSPVDVSQDNQNVVSETPVEEKSMMPDLNSNQDSVYNQDIVPVPENNPVVTDASETSVPVSDINPVVTNASETTLGTNLTVDHTIINLYQQYINDTTNVPSGFFTPEILASINSYNADQILNIWYSYIYGQPIQEVLEENVQPEEYIAELQEEIPGAETEQTEETGFPVPEETNSVVESQEEQVIAEIHEGEDEKALLIPADDNIIYRVQIAANQSQLDQKLCKMYYGKKTSK
ncbi:MAG: hypothetical protein HC906_11705 [Bacteroidales bacterium]|nr:hypothetical protein [Bacteroidales bacterium]